MKSASMKVTVKGVSTGLQDLLHFQMSSGLVVILSLVEPLTLREALAPVEAAKGSLVVLM